MAISYLGYQLVESAYQDSDSRPGGIPQITVPSGAELAIILTGQYYISATPDLTLAIDGVTATRVYINTTAGGIRAGLDWVTGFSTGSGIDFEWDWQVAGLYAGCPFVIMFFSGADTSDPIRDYDVVLDSTVTGSFSSSESDICVGWGIMAYTENDMTYGTQTEVIADTFNSCGYCACQKPGVAGSTTITRDTYTQGQMIGLSIKEAAGAVNIDKINGGDLSNFSNFNGGSVASWAKFNGGDV